jgi:hypothetical protein
MRPPAVALASHMWRRSDGIEYAIARPTRAWMTLDSVCSTAESQIEAPLDTPWTAP